MIYTSKIIHREIDWWIDVEAIMLSENITFFNKTCSIMAFIVLKTCKVLLHVIYGYADAHVDDFIQN